MEETQKLKSPASSTRGFDRRHWATRIGIPMEALREAGFREQYPFEPHLHTLSGHIYHYVDEGEGEPVVMVHGNPTWSYFYRNLIKRLSATHRCLAADHMGCGLSEKPQKYDYTLETHIRNLEQWLEETLPPPSWNGGRINLIVHDWGGPIGLGYAVRHPERIKRVVILNTSAFTEGDMPFCIKACRWPLLGALMVRGLNLFAVKATQTTTIKPLPQAVREHFILPYNSWANRIAIHRFVEDIPLARGTKTYKLFRKLGDQILPVLGQAPLLIQWGMKDWCFTPFFLDLWKKRFPLAEIDEYAAGHYLLEDAGEAIAARIGKFLERPAP